jgi:hypothetical protein
MPTRVQIAGVGTVEMDDAFKTKPQAEQQAIVDEIASHHAPAVAASTGPAQVEGQPSMMDKLAASPVGRFAHDAIMQPVEGMAHVAADTPMFGSGAANRLAIDPASQFLEQKYNDALARNRNTPGYAAARTSEDATMQKRGGSGFMDQVIAPLRPGMAGVAGLIGGGSLDSANAAADSQRAAMDDYRVKNPVRSAIGNVLGGALAGPEGMGESALNIGKLPLLLQSKAARLPASAAKATQYVGNLVQSAGKTPATLAQLTSEIAGKPLTAAEAIGRPGVTGLAALGRRSGETGDVLQGLIDERAAGAPGRVLSDYAAASGIDPNAAQGNIDAMVEAGRARAAPLYDIAHSQAPVITDRLKQFAQEPFVQQGMKEGIKTERLKALASGKPFDPIAYAVTHFNDAGDPVVGAVPTWRSWDAAKVGLDDVLDTYRDKASNRLVLDKRGSAINEVRKAMLNEVDAVNPAYAAARASAGDYLSASDAFSRGQKIILDPNTPADKFSKIIANLSESDLEAMKGGAANKLFNLAQNGKLDPKVFNRPMVQQKLTAMLGADPAKKLLANVRAEAGMSADGARMRPGNLSPTQELNAAMAEQDGGSGAMGLALDAGMNVAKHGPTIGAAKTIGQYARGPIDYLRTPGMSVNTRNEAGRLLMMPPSALADLLQRQGMTQSTRPMQLPTLTPQTPLPYGVGVSTLNQQGR